MEGHILNKLCGGLAWRSYLGHSLKIGGQIISYFEEQPRGDQHLGAYFERVGRWKYGLRVSPTLTSADPPPPLGQNNGSRNICFHRAIANPEVLQTASCPPCPPAGVMLTLPGWLPVWKETKRYHPGVSPLAFDSHRSASPTAPPVYRWKT